MSLDQVPKLLQDAVVAVEDESFWDNAGIDVNGLIRATRENFESGEVEQGGSTITQQLVKNRLLTPKRDIERKVREIVLSLQLAERYPKKEILEQYLNTVYFGQGAYGVQAASERFFLHTGIYGLAVPTPLAELSVGQSALLAGVISNPEGNNPFFQPERAKARRSFALQRMVTQHVITKEQAAAAELEPLPTILPTADLRPRNAWAEEVQDSIISDDRFDALGATRKDREQRVLTGGLRIDATLDPVLQDKAQFAIGAKLPTNKPGFTAALVAMDPRTGQVKAMVAGPGFEESQYNIATSYPGRQAGSTWKTITLAAALESGFSPNDRVSGSSPCSFGLLGKTQNAEGGGGSMTLRSATVNSVNCAYRAHRARRRVPEGDRDGAQDGHQAGHADAQCSRSPSARSRARRSRWRRSRRRSPAAGSGTIRSSCRRSPRTTGRCCSTRRSRRANAPSRPRRPRVRPTSWRRASHAAPGPPHDSRTVTSPPARPARPTRRPTRTSSASCRRSPRSSGTATRRRASPAPGSAARSPRTIFKAFMDAALEGVPPEPFPDKGPTCDREGTSITEFGRGVKPVPRSGGSAPPVAEIPQTVPTLPTRRRPAAASDRHTADVAPDEPTDDARHRPSHLLDHDGRRHEA